MMGRRPFIRAVGIMVVLAGPPAARSQGTPTVHRIGWLAPGVPPEPNALEEELASLRGLGWSEGRNLIVERRYTERIELLGPLAGELVRLKVELIVTEGTSATLAAKNATATIPIVMWSAGDPVGTGLVASLARPGGNITGYSLIGPESDAKILSLLREVLPAVQRVGELQNSNNPYYRAARKGHEQAYRSLNMQPIFVEVSRASELEDAVADVARQRGQALHVPLDQLFFDNAIRIMRAASRYGLATIIDANDQLETGALLSYGPGMAEQRRRGAAFIDKILRGAKPGDLPVEQPTQFELGINLKTAKALGISVPQSLLLRADRVVP